MLGKGPCYIACLLLIIAILTSCRKIERDHELIGSWNSQGSLKWNLTLTADGSGIHKRLPDFTAHSLTWYTRGKILVLHMQKGVDTTQRISCEYRLLHGGNSLELTSEIIPNVGKTFSREQL